MSGGILAQLDRGGRSSNQPSPRRLFQNSPDKIGIVEPYLCDRMADAPNLLNTTFYDLLSITRIIFRSDINPVPEITLLDFYHIKWAVTKHQFLEIEAIKIIFKISAYLTIHVRFLSMTVLVSVCHKSRVSQCASGDRSQVPGGH